jgi:hypothetical protein
MRGGSLRYQPPPKTVGSTAKLCLMLVRPGIVVYEWEKSAWPENLETTTRP